MFHIKKSLGVRIFALFTVLIFVCAPLSPTFTVKKADALSVAVVGGNGTIQETISAVADVSMEAASWLMEKSTYSLVMKETVLDGIAWALINATLHQMSQSIITWINSGFQGNPTFVQDLNGFLLSVADKTAGDFIWGSDLSFLCSPYELDIRAALDVQYRQGRDFGYRSQCTLTGVVQNMDDFLNGNFAAGGWDGWYALTQNPQNNIYGATELAQAELEFRIANAKNQEIKLLDFGKGFFSMKQCEAADSFDSSDTAASGQEVCSIVTPGTAIEAQLNNTLDSGQRRLQVADEINEIVAALFSQLASQAFSGAGGLLGLTSSGYNGGSGNYYDALNGSADLEGFQISSTNPIQRALDTELDYRDLQQDIVDMITDAQNYQSDQYPSCSANRRFPTSLSSQLSASQADVSLTTTIIAELTDMNNRFLAASGTPNMATTQTAILNEYLDYESSGQAHTASDVSITRMVDIPAIDREIDEYVKDVDRDCQ